MTDWREHLKDAARHLSNAVLWAPDELFDPLRTLRDEVEALVLSTAQPKEAKP